MRVNGLRTMLRTALLGSAVFLMAVATAPRAEASCEYPHKITMTYYAWVDSSGTIVFCHLPPGWDTGSIHPAVVGEKIIECDGSTTSWGDTTTCDPVVTVENCEPICD